MNPGILFALLTATISGFSIFYNKLVIVKGIDPQVFNVLKNGGVGIALSLYFFVPFFLKDKDPNSAIKQLSVLTRKGWALLVLIAFIGGSIPFILFFEGLKTVPAINANILQKTMFLWAAAFAIPYLKEKISPWQVIGYALVIWSNLFIGGFSGFKWTSAEWMIIGAAIFWGIETVIIRKAVSDIHIHPQIIAWARMMLGITFILGYIAWQGHLGLFLKLQPAQALPILGSIAFLTAYVTSWTKALQLAPATIVSSILILATPITNILSAAFITHTFGLVQIENLFGTIIGLIFITLLTKRANQSSISSLPAQAGQ